LFVVKAANVHSNKALSNLLILFVFWIDLTIFCAMQKQVTKRQEMLDFAEKQPANEPQPIMSFFYNVSSK
jgi:hypothetical protein